MVVWMGSLGILVDFSSDWRGGVEDDVGKAE